MLKKYNLKIAAVNVNVKAEPEFRNGGLTSNRKEVRAKAVRFIKEAKDFAEAAGADKVTCCPLGDGYEFAFPVRLCQGLEAPVETFGEAGTYKTKIPLFIEYKPSETRGRCFVDTAAKALCLLNDMQVKEMGVTLDFGHSTYGNENPAEALVLLAESPYRYYIHINDNDGRWDWDYFCGTKHFLEYVEFLYYLKNTGTRTTLPPTPRRPAGISRALLKPTAASPTKSGKNSTMWTAVESPGSWPREITWRPGNLLKPTSFL
jgi:xylose isomerase